MARPSEPSPQTLTDVPRDWPALWARLLAVRLGTATSGHAGPALSNGEGWRLQGRYSARSAELFSLYKPLLDARTAHDGRPWVIAQMGQSLDGFVATASGDSYYVNGAHSLLHLHRLRALCDAVLVGVGTVAIDDPQLTTRRVPGPSPVRVLFDPSASLDGHSRALRDGLAPTLWLCDERHAQAARERLPRGPAAPAEVLGVPGLIGANGDGPGVRRAVAALAERGLRVLFVEGGGVTVSRFFAAGALQRLHLAVAPVLVGQGRRGLRVPAQTVMADCPRPPAHRVALGEDTLWDLDLSGQVPQD